MRSAGKPETNNESVNTGVLDFDPTRRLKNHTTRRVRKRERKREGRSSLRNSETAERALERATPFTQAAPAISAPSVAGPLLAALSPGSAHGPQQTHVSLAVLALWRMTEDYAARALPEKGCAEAEQRLGEIIRCLCN
jgi:hypothetical protein